MKKSTIKSKIWLYIDGVSSRDLVLALLTNGKVLKHRLIKNGTRTEKLLPSVMNFISKMKITGLVVVQGAGSFSQTRLLCTITNTLAYAYKLPIVEVEVGETWNKISKKLNKSNFHKLILPHYSGPGVG